VVAQRGIGLISAVEDVLVVCNRSFPHDAALNALGRPYRGVAGVAELYRRWAEEAKHFTFSIRNLSIHYFGARSVIDDVNVYVCGGGYHSSDDDGVPRKVSSLVSEQPRATVPRLRREVCVG
jgi:hypothetical protein